MRHFHHTERFRRVKPRFRQKSFRSSLFVFLLIVLPFFIYVLFHFLFTCHVKFDLINIVPVKRRRRWKHTRRTYTTSRALGDHHLTSISPSPFTFFRFTFSFVFSVLCLNLISFHSTKISENTTHRRRRQSNIIHNNQGRSAVPPKTGGRRRKTPAPRLIRKAAPPKRGEAGKHQPKEGRTHAAPARRWRRGTAALSSRPSPSSFPKERWRQHHQKEEEKFSTTTQGERRENSTTPTRKKAAPTQSREGGKAGPPTREEESNTRHSKEGRGNTNKKGERE